MISWCQSKHPAGVKCGHTSDWVIKHPKGTLAVCDGHIMWELLELTAEKNPVVVSRAESYKPQDERKQNGRSR